MNEMQIEQLLEAINRIAVALRRIADTLSDAQLNQLSVHLSQLVHKSDR